jgi:hypothetical protein
VASLKTYPPYPLEIWTWESCYAASWGHHKAEDVLASLASDFDIHPIKPRVSQGYARLGFSGEDPGLRCVYHAGGPGRGVRPITEVEWMEQDFTGKATPVPCQDERKLT